MYRWIWNIWVAMQRWRRSESRGSSASRPVLDGPRGVAILLVMLTHTGMLPNGYVGVDLFFALSGFLITTLLYEEWERVGRSRSVASTGAARDVYFRPWGCCSPSP